MTNPNGARGTRWATACVTYLRAWGFPLAERRAQAGAKDLGDLTGISPSVVIECKDEQRLSFATYVDEAAVEANNAGADIPICFIKRRGRGTSAGYALTSIDTMVWILRQLKERGAIQ